MPERRPRAYTVRIPREQAQVLDDFCRRNAIRPSQLLRFLALQVARGRFSISADLLTDLDLLLRPRKGASP